MVPLDVQHLVMLRRDPVLLIFLDYDGRNRLLLERLRAAVDVSLFLFLIGLFQLLKFVTSLGGVELFFAGFTVGVLEVTLVLILIDVWDREDFIGMRSSRPDADISVNAASGKVLVLKLRQSDDLDDLLVMSVRNYVMLVSLVEAHYNEVALTEGRDQQVHLFSCEPHRVEGLVRFISIAATLEVFVPDLKRHVV